MDFIIDQYILGYLPFIVSSEMRKSIIDNAVNLIVTADWWCKARDPRDILENHTSFLAAEMVFFFLCTLTFIHAYRYRGRYLYAWIGILVLSLVQESLPHLFSIMDISWHAQGILTLFGMRTPLYLVLGVGQMIYYSSYVLTKRVCLPCWASGPLAGLITLFLSFPYEVVGIKLLWWSWHDMESIIGDRVYSSPWTIHCLRASTACSFVWLLDLFRTIILPYEYNWKCFVREFLCCFLAGFFSFWFGLLQFFPIYHLFHDYLTVHTECVALLFLGIYAVLVYAADRNNKRRDSRDNRPCFDELSLAIFVHFLFFTSLTFLADPENILSIGMHQPIGRCDQNERFRMPTGLWLERGKNLCPVRYDEKVFDFHCLNGKNPPKTRDGIPLQWYPICGTEFPNQVEFIFVVWASTLLFMAIIFQWAIRSGNTPIDSIKRKNNEKKRKLSPSPSQSGDNGNDDNGNGLRRRSALSASKIPKQDQAKHRKPHQN